MEKRARRPKGEHRGSGVLYEAPHTLNSRLRPRTPLVRGRENLSFASGLPQISGASHGKGDILVSLSTEGQSDALCDSRKR